MISYFTNKKGSALVGVIIVVLIMAALVYGGVLPIQVKTKLEGLEPDDVIVECLLVLKTARVNL